MDIVVIAVSFPLLVTVTLTVFPLFTGRIELRGMPGLGAPRVRAGRRAEQPDGRGFDPFLVQQHHRGGRAERGVVVTINSDSDERARRLYQEAAKAMHYGGTSEEEALKMITLNAAKQLGVDKRAWRSSPGIPSPRRPVST